MHVSTLMGVGKVTGLPTTLVFDPTADPSHSWTVSVGDQARGTATTAEAALDAALRELDRLRGEQIRSLAATA